MTARPQDVALLPEPKFGDWLRGIYASESNPIRDGMYVRTIRRTGRMNPGKYYELTDGKGKFWQYLATSTERLDRANVTAALASAQAREEELRAEVERLRQMTCKCVENNARMSAAEVRADQLGQAAARLADSLSPGLPLNKKARRAIAEIRALSTNAATQTGERT